MNAVHRAFSGSVAPIHRAPRVALAILLMAGCSAAPAASGPGSLAPGAPTRSSTASVEASASPTESAEPADPAETDATPVDELDRATGSGTITVEGVSYELEVAVCGWAGGSPTAPLQADPGAVQAFEVMAFERVGTGAIAFELGWHGVVGTIDTAVILLDPSDPEAAFHYHYDLQSIDLVEIEGGRVRTREALAVFDGTNIMTAGQYALEVDITCDTFGGTSEGALAIVTEITGLEPVTPDSGAVTIDGTVTAVDVTRCRRSGDEVELEAQSADGSISMTLSLTPGFPFLFFSVDGRVLTVAGDVDIAVDESGVATTSPIRGEIAGRGPAEVTFELPCA